MSIENYYGAFRPVCDTCGETLPPDADFEEAVIAIKEAGWDSEFIDGEWMNACEDCKNA